jgi:hypothetical protein
VPGNLQPRKQELADVIHRLCTYDGWAPSTSAIALPAVLPDHLDESFRSTGWLVARRPV